MSLRRIATSARRARPEMASHLAFAGAQDIRDEIARAVPFYRGIETLRRQGDQVQYGGRHLCAGGRFETADGRARFEPVVPTNEVLPPGTFRLTTRRGRQFNSIVHGDRDPLTGAAREDLLIATEDADRLAMRDGDRVRVRSAHGARTARVRRAPIHPGNRLRGIAQLG